MSKEKFVVLKAVIKAVIGIMNYIR